ncbi:hypothetical protein [Virgibacillus sp. 6R]|uniref:hypothetical protein n=1 Tax=Virgibacillus sp. 6R TaxID=1911587 RepID=UPI0018DB5479|nr:hypothetical protein [Virgibacillus sp. 6R]MBS7427762.1 hypothetical protein [Virgibacillus sp. 19R1-5]
MEQIHGDKGIMPLKQRYADVMAASPFLVGLSLSDEPMILIVGRISKVASLLGSCARRGYSVIFFSTSASFYTFLHSDKKLGISTLHRKSVFSRTTAILDFDLLFQVGER